MRAVRMSTRLNDRANLSLAEEGCRQLEIYLAQMSPAALDRFQDWLRTELMTVECYLKRLNVRDRRRKERWKRRGRPDRDAALRRELHLEQVERRKWVMGARRQILRQIGDACAWAVLGINPRVIQPLYAKGRNHYLSDDQGSFGPQSIMKQAHASGRFFVLDVDLTRCLGIGDLVVVPVHDLWIRPLVFEVKTRAAEPGHVAIWLIGANPTTPVDSATQKEFVEVLGLSVEPEQPLRDREVRQLDEVKAGSYRVNELWQRISRVLRQPEDDHWPVIARVLNRAEQDRIAFDLAEPGVVYAAIREAPGDNSAEEMTELLGKIDKHGFGARDGYTLLSSIELNDPQNEAVSSMALPIALWKLDRDQRSMLMNDVLTLLCFFDAKVWEKVIGAEGIVFDEQHGWWRLSRGNDSIALDPHEVLKLKTGLAFGGMSPRAFARAARESLDANTDKGAEDQAGNDRPDAAS